MSDALQEIGKINDLRARVLAGEDVSPEEFREVLITCRRLRREAGASEEKKERRKSSIDVDALLDGVQPGTRNKNPLDEM